MIKHTGFIKKRKRPHESLKGAGKDINIAQMLNDAKIIAPCVKHGPDCK